MALASIGAGDRAAARAPFESQGVIRPDALARVLCPPFWR
jgi:hypothetical protein